MSPSVQERYDFYEGVIFPTAYFGGTQLVAGWDCSLYTFQEAYNNIVTINSPFNIEVEFDQIRNNNFEISANVIVTENMQINNNKIFFVITNWIDYTQDNPWFYLVVAKSEEQDVTIYNSGENAVYSTELSVEMKPGWALDDLHAIAIIQNWDDHKILQAEQVNLYSTSISNPVIPADIVLHQNYPNPFNPETTIMFSLAQNDISDTELIIFNTKGQKIKDLSSHIYSSNLVERQVQAQYRVVWNGTDDNNDPVSSGIYFYKLRNGMYTSTKKMILMK